MPSFDIVSEVDLRKPVTRWITPAVKVESRFDFRGVEATFELTSQIRRLRC
ncbi:DUF520 family protein [Shigella flexneri]